MGTLSNNSKVGDKGKDLILQTSGRVYVQVKDRFYPINFRDTDNPNSSENSNTSNNSNIKGVLIVDNLETYSGEYPGDGTLVIDSSSGSFYQASNNSYTKLPSSAVSDFKSPINIQLEDASQSPLVINSNALVENLNAEYLSGYSSRDYTKKASNERIEGNWSFPTLVVDKIVNKSGTTYFDLSRGELMTSSLVTNTFSSNSTRTSIVKKTSNGDIYIQLSSEMFTPSILGLSGETVTTTEEDGSEKEQVNYSPWIYITVGNENDKYSTNGVLSSSTYKFTTDGEAAIGRVKKEDVDGKISYSPWIDINSSEAILSAETYQFKSDKTATIGPIVLNNDGTISIGNYTIDTKGNLNIGHIKIYADGTATIGSGEYQATIDAEGKFQIPEKCIIKENI
jgi:hypothetical protein